MAEKTDRNTSEEDTLALDENVALEVGHIIWYLKTGSKIEDAEELQKSWNEEYPEMKSFASSIIQHMFTRGMSISYFDRDMSHFGKQ